jgi:hypothetical protein
MNAQTHRVFVTGGTGYVGRPLIARLLERGHEVQALVRPGSVRKLPTGCQAILGDALDCKSYTSKIAPADTFVQLVGVSHPNPSKATEFRNIDLASGRSAVEAAQCAGVKHFCLRQRGPPCAGHEGLHRSQVAMRSHDRPERNERHDSAPLVRPRAGTPMAVCLVTDLQTDGAVAFDSRGRQAPGTGHVGTDGSGARPGCRNSS